MDPAPADRPQMVITGERTVPGLWHENYWFRRHEVVYADLLPLVAGRRVLEAGCGEGYGAAMLATGAAWLVAVDDDPYCITHAARAYPGLAVVRANLVALPFADAAFDVVVSLQTVEHLWDQGTFVAECARVLRPGGRLVLSTPNTLTFPPGNPFHPHELDPEGLAALVGGPLRLDALVGLRHSPGLAAWESQHGGIVDRQLAGPHDGWAPALAARVAAVTHDDFVLTPGTPEQLADSLDLVVLATRVD